MKNLAKSLRSHALPRNTVMPDKSAPPFKGPDKPEAQSFSGVLPKAPSDDHIEMYEPEQIHRTVTALKVSPSTQ